MSEYVTELVYPKMDTFGYMINYIEKEKGIFQNRVYNIN